MNRKINRLVIGITALLLVVSLGSCRDEDSPESIANDMCSCILDAGFSAVKSQGTDGDVLPQCAQDIADRIKALFDSMSKEEKAEFTRELLKAMLDTNCVDFMIKQMGHERVMSYIFTLLGK